MRKNSFLLAGKHPVMEAIKNKNRKIVRIYITENSFKQINKEYEPKNIFNKIAIVFKNNKELISYAYSVAGTVGIMMSSILNINNNIARKYAVDLGIAFQLTNIARDILEDAKINRIYIPNTWYSLTTKEIKKLNDKSKEKLKSATKDLLNMADLYYQSAFKGLAFLSLRNRFAILLALVIYKQIGVKIMNKNYSNLYIREKVSFLEKLLCLMKCVFLFIFNLGIHKKVYEHNKVLHKHIKSFYI